MDDRLRTEVVDVVAAYLNNDVDLDVAASGTWVELSVPDTTVINMADMFRAVKAHPEICDISFGRTVDGDIGVRVHTVLDTALETANNEARRHRAGRTYTTIMPPGEDENTRSKMTAVNRALLCNLPSDMNAADAVRFESVVKGSFTSSVRLVKDARVSLMQDIKLIEPLLVACTSTMELMLQDHHLELTVSVTTGTNKRMRSG